MRGGVRGRDGYLMVFYKLGLRFQTYDQWIASGARSHRFAGPHRGEAGVSDPLIIAC
jgi:hypothetical protein